jgi:DNA invertase Pin-like site-specific DNA recombinase
MTSKHTGQLVGYIRVSTLDQNTVRQEEQLQGFNLDAVFTDKASGKDTARPELSILLPTDQRIA